MPEGLLPELTKTVSGDAHEVEVSDELVQDRAGEVTKLEKSGVIPCSSAVLPAAALSTSGGHVGSDEVTPATCTGVKPSVMCVS